MGITHLTLPTSLTMPHNPTFSQPHPPAPTLPTYSQPRPLAPSPTHLLSETAQDGQLLIALLLVSGELVVAHTMSAHL